MLDLGIDLEARGPARPADLLTGQVDLSLARLRDRRALLAVSCTGSSPILVQLERKMSAKLEAMTAWNP